MVLRLKIIACKVLEKEINFIGEGCGNEIDAKLLEQHLHNEPDKLRDELQAAIDMTDASEECYDAILLGYGLCSNATAGVISKKHSIVIPKAHDCITLLLGSKEWYKEYFDKYSGGVYWYSIGWIDNSLMPSEERYEVTYNEYLEKYGEDNALYLMEMEQDWMNKYSRGTYIGWNSLPSDYHIGFAKDCAEYMKWDFEQLNGSPSLMADFLGGNWRGEDFAVIPPNHAVTPTDDEEIIGYR